MGEKVLWPEVATVAIVGIQLLVLVVAAFVAWSQAREARRLREQQSRPFVVIDFSVERGVETFLEISNLGNSLARDVTFEIDPPLKSAVDVPVEEFKMLKQGIKTLPPGKRFRTFFDIGFERVKSDLPLTHAVTVRYRDEDGKRSFEEALDLDLELFMHLEAPNRRDVHDVHDRLKEIGETLRKWSWSGGGGLLTISRREADERSQQRRAEIEEHRSPSREHDDGSVG